MVKRIIDARKPIVRTVTRVTIDAGEDEGDRSTYRFALPKTEHTHTSWMRVEDEQSNDLPFEEEGDSKDDLVHFRVHLPSPVERGAPVELKITAILSHFLASLPESIGQDDLHFVVLNVEALFLSPYPTHSATVKVMLGTTNVLEYTKAMGATWDKSKWMVVYTNPNDETIAPYQRQPVRAHFAHGTPFITFTNVEREVEVSHWGNVAVEEHYDLLNSGAQLNQGFSRIDYQLRQDKSNSFRKLTAEFPGGARDPYYRDIIGNISSSNFRTGLTKATLELETRFPIFGGWKTSWYHGYNLPSERALSQDPKNAGRFTLAVPMHIPIQESFVLNDYLMRVVLPEQAYDVTVETPWPVEQTETRRFTYLDLPSAGRTVIELRSRNLVPHHRGDVIVSYSVPPFHMLREPLMLTTAFFALFATIAVASRIDLRIAPQDAS